MRRRTNEWYARNITYERTYAVRKNHYIARDRGRRFRR